ncbi:MAG: O-antigen ligase family protein [Alistipes sp.]|nr:O-antigen ligase family protein [Alistipes sp.]
MKALNVMLVMFTVYGVSLILSGETLVVKEEYMGAVSNKDYIKSIFISCMPIYTFFVLTKIGLLTDEVIRKWIPVFILVAIAAYFESQNANLAKAEEVLSQREEFTNNTGYLFLSIMPLLLFVKKPFVQYLLLLICGVFIIAAMKRGAILIFTLCLPLFIHSTMKTLSLKRKIVILMLIIGSALAILYYVSYMLDTSEYFNSRLQDTLEGNASNRESMYPHLLRQIFYYATPLQFLFGRGAWGTLKVSDNFAHNDWLEIGVNQGMLGIVVYIAYWIAFYITTRSISNSTARSAVTLIMFIFLLMTMFSMSYDNMSIYATIVIGYCMANYTNNNAQYAKNNMLYR